MFHWFSSSFPTMQPAQVCDHLTPCASFWRVLEIREGHFTWETGMKQNVPETWRLRKFGYIYILIFPKHILSYYTKICHNMATWWGNPSTINKQLTKNWEKKLRKTPQNPWFMDIHGVLWYFMVHCSTFQLNLHLPKVRKVQLTEQGSWWKTRHIAQISVMECLKKWIAPGFFYRSVRSQCHFVYMNNISS